MTHMNFVFATGELEYCTLAYGVGVHTTHTNMPANIFSSPRTPYSCPRTHHACPRTPYSYQLDKIVISDLFNRVRLSKPKMTS